MAVNWDFIITPLVLIILTLIVWSKVTKQTITEVIKDIKDIFIGGSEEIEEKVEGVTIYE